MEGKRLFPQVRFLVEWRNFKSFQEIEGLIYVEGLF